MSGSTAPQTITGTPKRCQVSTVAIATTEKGGAPPATIVLSEPARVAICTPASGLHSSSSTTSSYWYFALASAFRSRTARSAELRPPRPMAELPPVSGPTKARRTVSFADAESETSAISAAAANLMGASSAAVRAREPSRNAQARHERAPRCGVSFARMSTHDAELAQAFDGQAARFERAPVQTDPAALARMVAFAALRADARVLDAGCGPGIVSEAFLSAGHRVHGVDLSPEMVRRARLRCERFGDRARFEQRSVREVEAGDFDASVSRFVVHHLLDPDGFFRAQVARLRPGAVLVACDH